MHDDREDVFVAVVSLGRDFTLTLNPTLNLNLALILTLRRQD